MPRKAPNRRVRSQPAPARRADARWVTATKLYPPRLRADIVERQGLLSELYDAVVSHPLTLVSAPAGYGKTTLLAACLKLHPELPAAWLSLDEDDNDPTRLLGAVDAAIRHALPTGGSRTAALLTSLSNPGAEARRAAGVLVNDILDAQPNALILILDDLYRVTEPAAYVILDYFLERLPPPVHLVVSTRHDPPLSLPRLRARGQLAEFRLHDLRFSLDETTSLLNGQLQLGLAPDELARLQSDTEGWAAGLRLVASALGRLPASERAVFIDRLTQAHAHVGHFLTDEVLSRQSDAMRAFLLETSILSELTPELCQAVTGHSNAAAILEDAYRRNLFLVAVDAAGTTYRYHHLFADFLRRRLADESPDRLVELHRRAAEAEIGPGRAIAHYLAAGLWDEAAKAVEQGGEQLLDSGQVHTLRAWVESFPLALREGRPRLLYFLGACALARGDLESAASLLERSRRGFEIADDGGGQGEALLGLVDVAGQQHDYPRLGVLIEQAITYPLPPHARVQLLLARVWQSINQGAWPEADADLDELLRFTLQSSEIKAFGIVAPVLRLHMAHLPAGTERLTRFLRQALARVGEGIGLVQAGAHSLLGYMYFLHGRMDDATREAEHAREISAQLGGFPFLDGEIHQTLTSVLAARGDHAGVERYWQSRLPSIQEHPALSFWTANIYYYIARAQWMQGRLEEARATCSRLPAVAEGGQELPEAAVAAKLMQALVEIGDRHYSEAERILHAAAAIEDRYPQCLVFSSARTLLAHLHLASGHPQRALAEFTPMLADCARREMPGLLLREGAIMVPLLRLAVERGVHATFAARVLALFGEHAAPRRVHIPETGETLSAREVEVLRLVAQGARNREIVERLVIAEATVKSHVATIFRKLNVTSRTQAAARARELGVV